MSMAIKSATIRARSGQRGGNLRGAQVRAALQGDPGFFGFLGDRIRDAVSFVRDPVGTTLGVVESLIGSGDSLSGGPGNGGIVSNGSITTSGFQQTPGKEIIDINFPFQGEQGVGVTLFGGRGGQSTALVRQNGNGACPVGSHLNKSSYFLKNGTFVPEGSRCVKNRRRNPLNPRAASRAISRLESAKKAVRSIDRFSIRCRRHSRMSCKECR